jgi:DNA-directed RNA polymerase subunit RPC12/RpoP
VSDKYPTCPDCGSRELLITFDAVGTRTFAYSETGRQLVADDVTDGGHEEADCKRCGKTMDADEIVWKTT